DEAPDQPGGRDAVHVGAGTGHPLPAVELREIERGSRLRARGFWTSGAHGDGLLETPDLGAAGGVEEIDVANSLMVFRQPAELLLRARADGLPLELLEHLAVADGHLAVVTVPWLMEEPQHICWAHVLDLLDPDERGVSAIPHDLLRQPLEVLVSFGGVGQQI